MRPGPFVPAERFTRAIQHCEFGGSVYGRTVRRGFWDEAEEEDVDAAFLVVPGHERAFQRFLTSRQRLATAPVDGPFADVRRLYRQELLEVRGLSEDTVRQHDRTVGEFLSPTILAGQSLSSLHSADVDRYLGKRIHPHSIRHSTAVCLLKSGVDFATISQWLGHANLNTTMRYARADIDLKRQVLQQVFPEVLAPPPGGRLRVDGTELLSWLRAL
jgi:hypothetical protein